MKLQFDQPAVDYPSAKLTFLNLKFLYKRPTKVIVVTQGAKAERFLCVQSLRRSVSYLSILHAIVE